MRASGLLLLSLALPLAAQSADPALLAAIQHIRAIDNHAHPPALPVDGVADTNYDALPCPPDSPTPPTVAGDEANPVFLEAWQELYGYPFHDRTAEHLKWLAAAKAKVRTAQGENYPNWVLDKLNIETELANRVAMGPGLNPPRFRWVAFDDALLLPFDDTVLAAENPDRRYFLGREKAILRQYLGDAHIAELPATLEEYIAQVVMPTLERQKATGAVAIKFESAYLRPLNFRRPEMAAAAAAYARGGALSKTDAYRVEDAIFHAIALKAGELHLAVHFHTGFGCGTYFDLRGANPMLLDGVLNDPSLRGTNFVLLHGGAGPYSKAVAGLISKPNVYTDFSEQTWLLPTFQVAKVLRYWLEYYPDKFMFGTDASPGTAEIDWAEYAFQANASGRKALAMALTGMMQDGEITRARALEIARMVMRGTALHLYGWPER